MEKKILLNGKTVQRSEPYQPNPENIQEGFVGRESEMELIMAAWIANTNSLPLSPVLTGAPGVGKNRLVYELSRYTGRDLYVFQGHEDISAEDLACTVRFSDETLNKIEYILSPLSTCLLFGGVFFCDEIGKIRPKALSLLASVLDERQYLDSSLLGERIHAHPAFRFIAATNTGEECMLPEFLRSRMRPVIKIGYAPRVEIEEIIRQKFKLRMNNLSVLLDKYWTVWNALCPDKTPTARDAIAIFSIAANLSEFESRNRLKKFSITHRTDVFALDAGKEPVSPSGIHIEKAIKQLFGS